MSLVLKCSHCGVGIDPRSPKEDYMLVDWLWKLIHPEGRSGFLHSACAVTRAEALDHLFKAQDFTQCLCFTNRHIHWPDSELMVKDLEQRILDRGSNYRGRDLDSWLFNLSSQDQRALTEENSGPWSHLFKWRITSEGPNACA